MSQSNQMSRDEVGAAIAERAWKDDAFRKAVLADPNKVYEEAYGEPLPGGVQAKVLEDTATTIHFVIPAKPAAAGELSDRELENVAGGVLPLVTFAVAQSWIPRPPKPKW